MRDGTGRRRLLAVTVTAAALAIGTWSVHAPAADDAETFEAAFVAGNAARRAAAEVGFEWRDTKKLLRQAKKLAEKGEYAKAIELANEARYQGEQGVAQAREQEAAWRAAVVK